MKWLKGRSPTAVSQTTPGRVLVIIDGTSIEVDAPVARLALDIDVRLALERVIADPLSKEGFDAVEIGSGRKVEKIGKPEGYAFLALLDQDADTFESRYRGPFSIVNLSFKEGNKWRLHDGKTAVNVTVLDENFLAKVNRNEVFFSKGDILICDVRILTRREPKGLKAEYFIERVVEHRHSAAKPWYGIDALHADLLDESGNPDTPRLTGPKPEEPEES